MYLIVILFLLLSVNLAKSKSSNQINVTDVNIKYVETLDTDVGLVIRLLNLPKNDFNEQCTATCESIGETGEANEFKLNCVVLRLDDLKNQYIDAGSSANVDMSFSGDWQCKFKMSRLNRERGSKLKVNFTFQVNGSTKMSPVNFVPKAASSASGFDWTYVWLTIGILAVLIIIGQALCIVRIWLKAKARTELANLRANQARDVTPDNTVRYTAMPTQVKMDQFNKNIPRESGIYEALETLPGTVPKPVPPPIDTLPRPVKSESPKTKEKSLGLSRNPSLARTPPAKPPKVKKDEHVSTIDRIKNRSPLPIPTDEPIEYEVMTPTTQMDKRPPVTNKVRTMIPPGMPPQVVPNFNTTPHQGPVLPSMIAAAQLKPVNKTIQWNQAQRKPVMEPKPYAPKNAVQTGFNPVPSFNRPGPPVMNKPPRPLPVQSIPTPDRYTESSDEDEWTYEPLPHFDDYNGTNIYDNVPR